MPPRSTRSANKEADTPGSKRKRRSSPGSPLKVVLPSPASLPKLASASPEKINGDVDHDSKRQKLSLKINLITEKPKDVKEEHPVDGALKKEIRESLSVVIAQMSVNLPPPLNNILALWLPPSFAQKEENTLGYVLKQPSLTWDQLVAGEWFTSAVDSREVQKRKGKDGDLLETNANAISLQSTLGGDASHNSPTLSDSLIRRASLKMNRWKERRAQRGFGGFGSVPRGVTSVAFTPSFGPTSDSYHATGGQGYWSTLEGMHERARHREWARRALRRSKNIDEGGYYGNLETNKGKEKETIDDVLAENIELIEELQTWQEVRIRKGASAVTEREQHVAEELLSSLAKLIGSRPPVDMLPASTSKVGLAHELARRFLPVSSPSIRGTLNPRRPQALHDNVTVKPRTMAGQTLGGSTNPPLSSPHAPPPIKLGVMPPPPIPQYVAPPPHTLPVGGRSNDNNRPSSTPSRSSYPPHSPSPSIGNTIYNNRPTSASTPPANPANTAPYPRSAVGPGPSNLRQSFGPGTPGTPSTSSNGVGYGMNGLGSASVRGMMMPGTSR
ncbi:hypothetical protein V865_008253 [Kwoniella europaea PYCC6329]|uniref:Uncharacterized protein n=1 Tax=Kwoniella europaea PYCC6329 TaxID=1423913 RepID=A0AAX4KWY9_9TREE